MNRYLEIAALPTSLKRSELEEILREGSSGVHESVLRSFQILQQVKILLDRETAPEIVLDLINLMETAKQEVQQ